MDDGTKTATKPSAPMSAYDKLLADVTKRFKRDTASHEMTVLHDDGLYRHLRFRAPERGTYWFDLVTWPGALHIRGDLGNSYTFSRLPDMFEFFRGKRINPHYWAQKTEGGRNSCKSYSVHVFNELVEDQLKEFAKEDPVLARTAKAEIFEAVRAGAAWDEEGARGLLQIWEDKGVFGETWEWDLCDYQWHFLWACYAIQWGIGVYDSKRTGLDDADPISALNFSVRVDNTLRREGIGTVGELVKLTGHDLLDIRNSGVKSLAEVIDKLGEHGRKLQEPPCPLPDLPTRRALNGGEH